MKKSAHLILAVVTTLLLMPFCAGVAVAADPVQWYAGSYPLPGGGSSAADLYMPPTSAGPGPFPLLVVVHGGGWSGGDKTDVQVLAQAAAIRGYVVLNANYPLAASGRPGWDMQPKAIESLINVAKANASTWRADTNRIAVWGHSAGATITAMVAARGVVSVRAAIAYSGVYDVLAAVSAAASLGPVIQPWTGCDPRLSSCRSTAQSASVTGRVTGAHPPTLLVGSAREFIPIGQLTSYSSALSSAGVAHRDEVLAGDSHGPAYMPDQVPSTLAWLDGVLGFAPASPPYALPAAPTPV